MMVMMIVLEVIKSGRAGLQKGGRIECFETSLDVYRNPRGLLVDFLAYIVLYQNGQ